MLLLLLLLLAVAWLCLGVVSLVRPVPVTQAPRIARRFARRVGIMLVVDELGRPTAGPEVEAEVTRLIWRLVRAGGAVTTGSALSVLLLVCGPPLSLSETQSLIVAGVICAGTAGPLMFVRPFLQRFSGPAPNRQRAAVHVDDYVGPVTRTVAWLAGASVLSIPLGAAALATTDSFDGSKIYWEGLVGLPLVSAGLLLAVEWELREVRDDASTDRVLLYLWDVLRGRSLRLLTRVVMFGAGVSWLMASDGLVGVALDPSVRPGWAESAHVYTGVLGMIFLVSSWVVPTRDLVGRLRRHLWPDLSPGEQVPWA